MKHYPFILTALVFMNFNLFAGEALDFVDKTIKEFNSLRSELVKDNSKPNRKKVRQKALKIAFKIVDLDEISRLALGNHYPKLSKAKKKKFKDLFHKIIVERITQANIPQGDKILKEKKSPIVLISDSKKKDSLFKKEAYVVSSEVKKKKTIYEIDIYLFKKGKKLLLYDLHIDQASILLDFKNQFARIIKKRGVDHLLSKLNKQVKKLNRN